MASKTCTNNVHKVCVIIASTKDTIMVLVEFVHSCLIHWRGQDEHAWPGFY